MQVGVTFLWLVSFLAGQTPEKAAIKAYQQGDHARAAWILELYYQQPRQKRERWSRWNARRMRVSYLAGRIALERQRPKDAIRWLGKVVKKPSQFRDYIAFTLAASYHQAGKPKQAIALYRYMLKEFGRHWRRRIRRRLTRALADARQWKELGDHLKKLLWYPTPYGGRRKVLWQMTQAYVKAGQIRPMLKWLREFPLRYPHSKEARAAKKLLAQLQHENPKLKLRPWRQSDRLNRLYNMAYSYPERAIQALSSWRSALVKPKKKDRDLIAQLDLSIARAHLSQRRYGKIIPIAKPLLSYRYPQWIRHRATVLLGHAYIGEGLYVDGWKLLHKFAERFPTAARARWASRWSAYLAMLAQDYKRARRYFWEYIKVYPDLKPKDKLRARWFRAWCLFRMGKYRRTLSEFRTLARSTRWGTYRRRIRYWTARTYERWGKWSQARKQYSHLVRYSALTYYGILAKRRLYLLEIKIRRQAQVGACFRRKLMTKALATPAPKKATAKKGKKSRKQRKRRRKKPKGPEPMRVKLDSPLWKRKFTAPWREGWRMMMELEQGAPSTTARLDETMRDNVHMSIKKARKVVPFPKIPGYCERRNSRQCKYVRRARLFARLGLAKEAVDELFRGRWAMRRPRKRLIATIRWFRSVAAHHEAIRMTYWLRNWSSAFKPNVYYRLRYPPAHARLLFKYTKTYGVSLAFAWGIMREESLFFRYTYSWAAARGLMQIIPRTAYRIAKRIGLQRFTLRELYAPNMNIRMGCWYLGQLLQKFESNIQLAAAAYNAGPHRVVAWLRGRTNLAADEFSEEIPFNETRKYVRRVLRSFTVYNYLYRRSLPRPLTTVAVRIGNNINF